MNISETKSRRINLALSPENLRALRMLSAIQGKSLNTIVDQYLRKGGLAKELETELRRATDTGKGPCWTPPSERIQAIPQQPGQVPQLASPSSTQSQCPAATVPVGNTKQELLKKDDDLPW